MTIIIVTVTMLVFVDEENKNTTPCQARLRGQTSGKHVKKAKTDTHRGKRKEGTLLLKINNPVTQSYPSLLFSC